MKEISRDFKVEKPDGYKWLAPHCDIAGISHQKKDALIFANNPSKILLFKQPENKYDSNAIMVCDSQGRKLGYIPKEIATVIAELPKDSDVIGILRGIWVSDDEYIKITIALLVKTNNSVSKFAEKIQDIQNSNEETDKNNVDEKAKQPSFITGCGCLFLSVVVIGGLILYVIEKLK